MLLRARVAHSCELSSSQRSVMPAAHGLTADAGTVPGWSRDCLRTNQGSTFELQTNSCTPITGYPTVQNQCIHSRLCCIQNICTVLARSVLP